jgi:hypothetical protein
MIQVQLTLIHELFEHHSLKYVFHLILIVRTKDFILLQLFHVNKLQLIHVTYLQELYLFLLIKLTLMNYSKIPKPIIIIFNQLQHYNFFRFLIKKY